MSITNSCSVAPLSSKQRIIWQLTLKGLSVAAIAKKLGSTRQYVNQTRLTAEAKLNSTLLDAAKTSNLQVTALHPRNGILVGYHPGLKRKALVTYSSAHGIKIWYWHDRPEEVTDPEFLSQTRKYLLELAEEREIRLDETDMHPARLAQTIFERLAPELQL